MEVGGRRLFGDLSFAMEPGGLWLIRGDCGSGKSVLAKTLAGLVPALYEGFAVRGEVRVFGLRPVEALRRGLVLYLPQDVSCATLTDSAVEELAAYGLEGRVPELRRLVGDLAQRDLRRMSAGERYRVLVALSTLLGKRLVVVDEPSGYLDRTSMDEVLDALERYAAERDSVVAVVEHRREHLEGRVVGVVDLGPKTTCACPRAEREGEGGLLVRARNVRFSYSGAEVLRGVDVEVESGSVVAVVGPNGSGKTTLLKLLLGLLRPRSGTVERRYRRVLYVPQLSCHWMGGRLEPLLSAFGCTRDVLRSAGVENSSPASMSLGEVRRLSVYVGVYGNADVVAVDEVSLGFDSASLACLRGLFEEARRVGKGVIFTTHDASLAKSFRPDAVVELP